MLQVGGGDPETETGDWEVTELVRPDARLLASPRHVDCGHAEDFVHLSTQRSKERPARTGLVSSQEVERALEASAQPSLLHVPFVMVTAWGQRPAADADHR